jgi:hypothetical protein
MRPLITAVALGALVAIVAPAGAQPDGVAEPERGTPRPGVVTPGAGEPAPDVDVGERRTRPTTPDPDDATRHEPDTHGGSMPPTGNSGPTHPPGSGDTRTEDAH